MNQFVEYFIEVVSTQLLEIAFALCVIILFKVLSPSISYIIIRMFKIKTKNKKEIKESAFYTPLKVFISILGFYIAILYLKQPLQISEKIMAYITIGFKIISVMAFAKGLAASFMPKSSLVKKMKQKANRKADDTMFDFFLKGFRVLIYVAAGFIVLALLGINLNGLVAGLGIGGVIVTLAAQDTAKNLFGGLVIFLDKPFNVGDWVEMTPFEGIVEDITFRSTRIRTFENSVVNVPNSVISNTSIINWSKMEQRRYKINLLMRLDTPLEKLQVFKTRVCEMLQSRDNIQDDSIIVKYDEIKENGINVLIISYTDSVDYESYLSERENINYKIMKILREENIKLADTQTIHIKN